MRFSSTYSHFPLFPRILPDLKTQKMAKQTLIVVEQTLIIETPKELFGHLGHSCMMNLVAASFEVKGDKRNGVVQWLAQPHLANFKRLLLRMLTLRQTQSLMLLAGDVFNALLVATTCKFGVEELVETLTAYVFGDETTREDDDVGVVVLTDEVGNFWLPNKACTDALVLVEGHGDAFARTAHGDAWIDFAFLDAFGQSVTVGGIVAGLFSIGAVVLVS